MRELGLFGLSIPVEYGGLGLTMEEEVLVAMELGHTSPAFRYAVLLRGIGTASVEQVEDLVDIAVSECERFYPAFQLVIWGGKSPEEAMATAMIEPIGEA